MKGRALLHHNVQLDDRAILGSVPGVKDGTILRVDKQVSQVKKNTNGRKRVLRGPTSSAVDEDVVESIEMSGDNEETSSENERRLANSKRKRTSKTFAENMEDFFDDNIVANTPPGEALVLGEMSVDSLSLADTNLSSRGMAVHIMKEKRQNTAREQADFLASEAQKLGHRLGSLQNIFAPPLEQAVENPTASAHVPKTNEAVSSHQDVMEDDDASFLFGINAAAAEAEYLRPKTEAGPEEDVSARRCDACGRVCGCGTDPLAMRTSVAPVEESIRAQEAASTNSNSNGHLLARRNFTSQRTELSWTGM